MALPHARRITVRGRTFWWLFRGPKTRLMDDTPRLASSTPKTGTSSGQARRWLHTS